MNQIRDISDYLIILIRAGAVLRIIYCFTRIAGTDEEQPMYRKRIRNVIIFYILAEAVWMIKDLMTGYFA